MIGLGVGQEAGAAGDADDLLTRAEASAFLSQLGIQLKPAIHSRLWSTG